MRVLILSLIFLIALAVMANADTRYVTDFVLEWDPSTTYTDGTPYDPGDVVEYEIYSTESPIVGDPQDLTGRYYGGVVTGTSKAGQLTPDLTGQAYKLGVRTKVTTAAGAVLYSDVVWIEFDVEYSRKPGVVTNLRIP